MKVPVRRLLINKINADFFAPNFDLTSGKGAINYGIVAISIVDPSLAWVK